MLSAKYKKRISNIKKAYKEKGLFYLIKTAVLYFFQFYFIKYWYLIVKPTKKLILDGKTYNYFYHRYNLTWQNERAIEIPFMQNLLNEYTGKDILEVGNVLSHYLPDFQHDILDKYEKADGVINEDIVSFQPVKKYDLIISISTLEHVGWDEQPKDPSKIFAALANLKKLLKPNGKIAVTLPLGYNQVMDKSIINGQLKFTKVYYLKRFWGNNWVETNFQDMATARHNYPFGSDKLIISIINNNRSSN